jgi:hypothetical protein
VVAGCVGCLAFGIVGTWIVKPILCFLLTGMGHGYASGEFDEEAWRRNWSAAWCWRCTPVRMAMAPQLVESGRLIGMNRQEIQELLGETRDRCDEFRCISPEGTSMLLWSLAPSMTDTFWLVIEFDRNDVAVRAAVQED